MITNECEWCGTRYPDFDETEIYFRVNVFMKDHTICGSCFNHLCRVEKDASSTKNETRDLCFCKHDYQAHAEDGGDCMYAKPCPCMKFRLLNKSEINNPELNEDNSRGSQHRTLEGNGNDNDTTDASRVSPKEEKPSSDGRERPANIHSKNKELMDKDYSITTKTKEVSKA